MDTADIGTEFDIPSVIRGLNQDLLDLRAGHITAKDAQARADLAKQVFNGLRIVVQAQKFLSVRARQLPATPAATGAVKE